MSSNRPSLWSSQCWMMRISRHRADWIEELISIFSLSNRRRWRPRHILHRRMAASLHHGAVAAPNEPGGYMLLSEVIVMVKYSLFVFFLFVHVNDCKWLYFHTRAVFCVLHCDKYHHKWGWTKERGLDNRAEQRDAGSRGLCTPIV